MLNLVRFPKIRMRGVLLALLLVPIILFALIASIHRGYFATEDELALIKQIQQQVRTNKRVPVERIAPWAWTHVCVLDEITKPVDWLSLFAPGSKGVLITVIPEDAYILPDHWGLVFYDAQSHTARVFSVSQHQLPFNPSGKSCFERKTAVFTKQSQAFHYSDIVSITANYH